MSTQRPLFLGFPALGRSGFRYTIKHAIQMPSPASGYLSATTAAIAKKHNVAIAR
jgi:hypothetical protein